MTPNAVNAVILKSLLWLIVLLEREHISLVFDEKRIVRLTRMFALPEFSKTLANRIFAVNDSILIYAAAVSCMNLLSLTVSMISGNGEEFRLKTNYLTGKFLAH